MSNQLTQTTVNPVATIDQDVEAFRQKVQNFINTINRSDPKSGVENTPDGKAKTIGISHIEMSLDELFLGLWDTENYKWAVISNEVVGSIDLVVIHPVTGHKIRRVGAAGIIITVNKGANALDVSAKKANALDLGFPKLKAECIKNAAQSLGKLFGRDLNRKSADTFNPFYKATTVN